MLETLYLCALQCLVILSLVRLPIPPHLHVVCFLSVFPLNALDFLGLQHVRLKI